MVDLDPQGNASSGVRFPRSSVDLGTYEVLTGEEEVQQCIHQRLSTV